ncbi:MAG TPA: wax ester/triacylglycerol synthase family O-acyltransferase [Thermoanaerobaculia bacterium]|nr:wax ester/triacylglycerol synthase family O-acyltransferase [Thermoanaerobaculia bacterium]
MTRPHSGRLTATDAAFLYFERDESPMHIGGVCLFEGEVSYEPYVESISRKLELLPRFREKLVFAPLALGHPTWETDEGFDVRDHVLLHRLPAGSGERELQELTNRLIAGKMRRDRPLWELHLVQGLEDGRSAMVTKVHHAMVDGVGGNAIMTTILDLERDPPPPRAPKHEYQPTTPLPPSARAVEAMRDSARSVVDAVSDHLRSMGDLARSFDASRLQSSLAVLRESMPDMALPPRRLPFNRPCSGERSFVWTRVPFAEARAIRSSLGGTVNDVMLATLGGAVGRYAELHGQRTAERSMRVMVPVNVRPSQEGEALGNLVSALPVDVPLGFDDPAARLRAVRAATRTLKDGRVAEGVSLLSNLAGTIPVPAQAMFGAVAASPFPPFNLVCTNVPGPQIPLYAIGQRLESYYPHVPVGWDLGVCCAIFSYNQALHVGLNSDTRACPDVERLRDLFDESFAELKAAAGVEDLAAVELGARRETMTGAPANADGRPRATATGSSGSGRRPATRRRTASKASKASKTSKTSKEERKAPGRKAPAKRAPGKKGPARKAPGRKRPSRKAPEKDSPEEKPPKRRSPEKRSSQKTSSHETASAGRSASRKKAAAKERTPMGGRTHPRGSAEGPARS